MSITVSGVLIDPLNEPESEVTIRIKSLISDFSLKMSEAEVTTGTGGEYNFTLVSGDFSIEIDSTKEYQKVGEIRIAQVMVGTYSLPELLTSYAIPVV